jgi:hypothetical protein
VRRARFKDTRGDLGQQLHRFVDVVHDPDGLRSSGVSIAVRTCCLILCGMPAQRAFGRVVPNKNARRQHSREVLVNKSFSHRRGSNVSHTRQGVVDTQRGLI